MPIRLNQYLLVAAVTAAMALVGCARNEAAGPAPAKPAATPAPEAAGTAPANPQPIQLSNNAGEAASRPSAAFIRGTGRFFNPPGAVISQAQATPAGDIVLNFENASIPDVAKAVLGTILKVNYAVAPNLQGTVTLHTSHPISRTAVLPALQAALRFSGATIVRLDGTWRVVSSGEAPREGEALDQQALARAHEPGFAVEVVPLRYISAENMQRLLTPVAPDGAILRVDQARNLLILGGTAQELAAMREQISTFDVDWLAGMSFALVPLKVADAKAVAGELDDILGRESGPVGNLVRVVPIERMNAVLLISPQPAYLDELRDWAARLDHVNDQAAVQLYVYHVQNGRAKDLAAVLRKVFNGEESSGSKRKPSASSSSSEEGSSVSGVMSPSDAPLPPLPGSSAPGPAAPPVEGAPSLGAAPPLGEQGAGAAQSGQSAANVPQIIADDSDNALLIRATASGYKAIAAALRQLDVPPLQVVIEASIAEVTLTNQLQYGVQYFLRSGNFNIQETATQNVPPVAPAPGFAVLFSAAAGSQAILNLLEGVTKVNVIDAPELVVLNNQTATLQVGDEVPVATASAVSVITPGAPIVNSIEYQDTGVILKITPRVNHSGLVLLDISQEVSSVEQTTSSTLDSPTISERRFTSSVAIHDGQTVALGGLISNSRTNTDTGIPLLRDIPYLGALFDNVSNSVTRDELLVMITPHVIRTQRDAARITDEFQRQMRAVVPLERKIQ